MVEGCESVFSKREILSFTSPEIEETAGIIYSYHEKEFCLQVLTVSRTLFDVLGFRRGSECKIIVNNL